MKIGFAFMLFSIAINPDLVLAQELIGSSLTDYSGEAFKVVLSLILVLAIFYFGALIFKKYLNHSYKENASIKLIGGMSLGNKEKLVLVEAGNVNLLLGVSAAGVTKLHKFDQEELLDCENNEEQQNDSFNDKLQQIIARKY